MQRTMDMLAALVLVVAVGAPITATPPDAAATAAKKIEARSFLNHVSRLASDEFEGRAPATNGETMTVNYLVDSFRKLGLAPGNPDGTYTQKVPLVSYKVDNSARLDVAGANGSVSMKFADDFVAWTRRLVDHVDMNGELVFAGYGAVAPEYGWDDFKDVDVRGKVIVVLINDPPIPDPSDPSKLDDKTFGGRAMTYYGRWTYKYEVAAAKGAAGCIIVHETAPASYGWEVVRNGRTGEQFTVATPDNNMSLAPIEGWMTVERAQEVFKLAGKDFTAAKQAALSRDFRPMPLGLNATLALKSSYRKVESTNVIAKLPGADPKLKNEFVIYTAHWDHFGIGEAVNGDKIYNGAVDNATGTAGLLELARAFKAVKPAPKRSILFLAVTAEERGLLGSAYYGERPLYPLASTVAAINLDAMNVSGRTKDVTVVGLGNSTLDDDVKAIADLQGRIAKPDPRPEGGTYYRSDHFNFAKQGVPALYVNPGVEFVGKPADFGVKERARYTAEDYHKPSDQVKPTWDVSGAVEDLQLVFQVGYRVANAASMPAWREGTEFKAKREQSLKAAGR
jgi:Zn-dependent M28 family amino/carboxypeptidase